MLAVVSVAVFLAGLDMFVVNVALPRIATDLDVADVGGLSWVMNVYAIVLAALLVPAGRLGDRIGRRRAWLGGLALFAAGSGACALAGSVEVLVAARALQATGGALLLPNALGLVLAVTEGPRRAQALAVWAAVGGLASAAGPVAGGVLVELSWRAVFWINLPLCLAAAVVAVRVLPEIRDRRALRPDLLGSVLLAGGVGALALALVEGESWGIGAPATLLTLGVAAVLLPAAMRRSARHPAPALDLELLRLRSFARGAGATVAFWAAFSGMLLASVMFLAELHDLGVLAAGLGMAPGPAAAAVVAVASGRRSATLAPVRAATTGSLLFAAGVFWWLAVADGSGSYAVEFLPGIVLTGIGTGLVLSTLSRAALDEVAPERTSTGSAMYGTSQQIGSVLGVAIVAAVLDGVGHADLQVAWGVTAGWAVVGALCSARLGCAGAVVRRPMAVAAADGRA